MRIAHIIPSLDRGGAERVVVTLANDAADKGHDVTIITAGPIGNAGLARELRPEIQRVSTSGAHAGRLSKYARLLSFLLTQREKIQSMDVVHVHLLFGTVAGSAVWAMLGSKRPRIVETFHAAGMPLAAWKRTLTAAMARCRDAFVLMADDPKLIAAVRARKRTSVQLIPNGIEIPDAAGLGDKDGLKRDLGIPASSLLIGTVGRLVEEREPEKMLQLFGHLHNRMAETRFILGGGGPLFDPLSAKVRGLGLSSRVHMPGPISNPLDLMKACDLYISINVGPLTGIAGLEAAAVATPVIALQARSDYNGGHSDWIWSDTGVEGVAARAEFLLRNPEERTRLAKAQQRYVFEHFSAKQMSDAYLNLYEKLSTGGGSRSSFR